MGVGIMGVGILVVGIMGVGILAVGIMGATEKKVRALKTQILNFLIRVCILANVRNRDLLSPAGWRKNRTFLRRS